MSFASILLVEDDVDIQDNLRLFLELEGFQVQSAFDGREAIDYLSSAKNPVNMIFLDLMMPSMNGYEFLTEFQTEKFQAFSEIPIVLISASSDLEQVASQFKTSYIKKPIDLELLLNKINTLKN